MTGLISVSFLKSIVFPTKSWALNFVEKAKHASSKEMQILETVEKTIPK